jgi:hypothetical protein
MWRKRIENPGTGVGLGIGGRSSGGGNTMPHAHTDATAIKLNSTVETQRMASHLPASLSVQLDERGCEIVPLAGQNCFHRHNQAEG